MEIINKFVSKLNALLNRDTEGYDVYDFRVGTIIGSFILIFIPIANWLTHDLIPDNVTARTILFIIQIVTIIASYKSRFIKKWSNEIGNLFSLLYAAIVITVAYQHNFELKQTAFAMLMVFGLCGMFKERRMLQYFWLITFFYLISLFVIKINDSSGKTLEDIKFLLLIAVPFFGMGYYIFNLKLSNIERISKRELEVKQREEWFRNIFDNAPVGIVLYDSKLNPFKFNHYFQKMTGYNEYELLQLGLRDLIHPQDVLNKEEFVGYFAEKERPKLELRMLNKTGKIIWVRIKSSKMEVSDNQFNIIMVTDITVEKAVDLQLRESAKLLSNQNKALEEFSYVISHDLQEPLRMITSFTQIIQKRYINKIEDPQAKVDFAFVIDGAKRMSNLIKDMLEYSRWSAKALPIEEVDTREVLSVTLQNLTVPLTTSHAEVIADDLPIIFTNKLMLGQVFQNLISNAIRYKHPDRDPIIEIIIEIGEKDFLFSFKDNGIGFEEEYKERIFGIFQKLDIERKDSNGMGLAICRRVIERQGGSIWAESVLHEGSTFFFKLPLVEDLKIETSDLVLADEHRG